MMNEPIKISEEQLKLGIEAWFSEAEKARERGLGGRDLVFEADLAFLSVILAPYSRTATSP